MLSDTHVVIMLMIGVVLISVSGVIERCGDVHRCSGNRVHRDRHCRQYRVSFVVGGSCCVSFETLIIGICDPVASVVTAQNHAVAVRKRCTQEAQYLEFQLMHGINPLFKLEAA